jgi:hypothetical protein
MPNNLVPLELLERFRNGDCVFFIGAGVSAESGLISGREFKEKLIGRIEYPRRDVALSKVAQAYEDSIDRQSLISLIIDQFKEKGKGPQKSHKLIAQLAKEGYFTHIITTNFDNLIEDALRSIVCEYHLSKRDIDVSSAPSSKKVHLVKFHGSVDDIETIVISEADYRGFFRNRPVLRNLLGGLLVEKTFIFLGYSLEDPDFDQIYHNITTALGDFQRLSYAVQQKPNDFSEEQWHKFHVDPWTRRKIRIITAKTSDFLAELQAKLKAPPKAIAEHKKRQELLLMEHPEESTLGRTDQVQTTVFKSLPLLNCIFKIEVRMDDDGGGSSRWFGIRIRGVTSFVHAGYLIYLRSNGNLDVTSIEERSILSKEVTAADPKGNFVKLEVSIIDDQIKVRVNDKQVVEESNRLVTWEGRVYLHTYFTKVTWRAAELFEVKVDG